jgi:hypothetical protein
VEDHRIASPAPAHNPLKVIAKLRAVYEFFMNKDRTLDLVLRTFSGLKITCEDKLPLGARD